MVIDVSLFGGEFACFPLLMFHPSQAFLASQGHTGPSVGSLISRWSKGLMFCRGGIVAMWRDIIINDNNDDDDNDNDNDNDNNDNNIQ